MMQTPGAAANAGTCVPVVNAAGRGVSEVVFAALPATVAHATQAGRRIAHGTVLVSGGLAVVSTGLATIDAAVACLRSVVDIFHDSVYVGFVPSTPGEPRSIQISVYGRKGPADCTPVPTAKTVSVSWIAIGI